jgi:aminopeptidase-like protein
MHALARRLYPFCRSITGEGLRQTLLEIQRDLPLALHEVPSGSAALDWEVPNEWNIRGARIETLAGRTLVDFAASNLHVVSYSTPIDTIVSREELAKHVHTIPERPELVPYRTGYHAGNWGFCLKHSLWECMADARYRVVIDSTLAPGSMTYGELLIEGHEPDEVLLSIHCCHPSLANDNLSAIVVATELGRRLLGRANRLSYRLLFVPATIGPLAWLASSEAVIPRIQHGLVLTCLGDPGPFHYKRSRRENAVIDRAVAYVLAARGPSNEILPFSPLGYDERQYCSPAYNLPVGCLMRAVHGSFWQYHTSADNLNFITPEALEQSVEVLTDVMRLLERNIAYRRVDGRGEPQLGRRGLYRRISGQANQSAAHAALMWVLNMSDGTHTLLDIAERSGVPFDLLAEAADSACRADLIQTTVAE